MLKKLRIKFIIISLASVTAVLLIIMTAIFAFNYRSVVKRADMLSEVLSANMGRFPRPDNMRRKRPDFTPETPYETRFFTVKLNESGEITGTDSMAIKALDSKDIAEYALRASEKGETGFLDSYRFRKSIVNGETMIVFVDCTRDLNMFRNFVITGLSVSLLGLLLVFIMVFFLSKFALAPVERAIAQQKRFITDASHELKTPLTVIDANLEVIEMENGESKWSENAREQVIRLRDLCNGMVYLSRLDESIEVKNFEMLDLSDIVLSAVIPFEALAETENRRLITNIEKGISAKGSKEQLTTLVTLLTDNAIKYSEGEGDITITLCRQGSKAVLEVKNPSGQSDGEHPEFFERFYRADSSRSDKKGFGIGLSTAMSIAQVHRGRLSAKVKNNFITFRFIF